MGVKVTYYPRFNRLTIEGHAGAGAFGHDLVCASVSAIWHTLAANAMGWKDAGELYDLRITEREGYCHLSYTSGPEPDYELKHMYIAEGIILGMEWLAQEYPEHIEFVCVDRGYLLVGSPLHK